MTDGELGPVAVPAGQYELRVHPDQYKTLELTVASPVALTSGAVETLELNSGLDVQASEKSDPPDEIQYIREGDEKAVQRWQDLKAWGPQILPPGRYRVSFLPKRYDSDLVSWPPALSYLRK